MHLGRWLHRDGTVYVGRVDGDSLTPLAVPARGEPDARILELAMTKAEDVAPVGPPVSRGSVRLLPPVVRPGVLRDFSVFEQHARAGGQHFRGEDLQALWYEIPVGYFGSPHRILADGEILPPPDTEQLDYELEVAAVVGRDLSDVTAEEAATAIAGYTIFNDWSARDIQRREKALGSGGPTKSKDFANSLGPYLATPDEMDGDPGRPRGAMVAWVNGREYSRGDLDDMQFSFASLIAYLSRDSVVRAGDVVGSGTCGTGCLLELTMTHGAEKYPWLQGGDVVELSVDGIGRLTNVIGFRPSH